MTGIFMCIMACFALTNASAISSYLRKRYTTSSCDGNQIYIATQDCYGELLTLSEMPTSASEQQLQNVQEMCRSLESSSACFSRRMKPCGEPGKTMALMLLEVFNYVCQEGMEVLMSSGACWAHETLKEDIGKCTERMEEEFHQQGFNGWCDITNDYIRCVGEEVESKTACTSSAAYFMREMVRRSIKPAAERMKCRLYRRPNRDLSSILLHGLGEQ